MAEEIKPPIYIFDSSAWIECNDRAGDNRIPEVLDKLRSEKRIRCPKQVFAELERPGEISEWAKLHRRAMNAPRGLPPEYAKNIGLVQHRYPGMGRAFGAKERADPYVVGLCWTYHSDEQPWIVVTAETTNNRPRRKIRGVCEELGLPCISLDEMLEREVESGEQAPEKKSA